MAPIHVSPYREPGVKLPYFSFRVQLMGVERPIWRSFLLREIATFEELHRAIQKACGWAGGHHFAFHKTAKGPVIAGIPNFEFVPSIPDAWLATVSDHFS